MQKAIYIDIQDNANLGDDLLFLAGIRLLNLYFSDGGVTLYTNSLRLSNLAIESSRFFDNIPSVCYHSPQSKSDVTRDSCTSIHLGGTIFSSKYTWRSRLMYIFRDNVKGRNPSHSSIYLSLGVDRNPSRSKFSRDRLAGARSIAVRDYSSFIAVTELTNRHDAFLLPDTVFSLPLTSIALGSGTSPNQTKHLNIVRSWPFGNICRHPSFYRPDYHLTEEVSFAASDDISTRSTNVYRGTASSMLEVLKLLKSAECLVSERYHGIVIALAMGKPVIGHAIDTKILSLASDLAATSIGGDYFLFLPGTCPDPEEVRHKYTNFFMLNKL